MTGFLLVLLLFKVYSVVSEWVQSDSPLLFVILMAFFPFGLFFFCLPIQVRFTSSKEKIAFSLGSMTVQKKGFWFLHSSQLGNE